MDEVDVFVEVPITIRLTYLEEIRRGLVTRLNFEPRVFPLFPKTLERPGFSKSKKFRDIRKSGTYTIRDKTILFSKLFKPYLRESEIATERKRGQH